jgi:lysophospholipase L1-like esterase
MRVRACCRPIALAATLVLCLAALGGCRRSGPTSLATRTPALRSGRAGTSAAPVWQVVMLGDSAATGVAEPLAAALDADLGVGVQLRLLTHGGWTSADLLAALRRDPEVQAAVLLAQVVVWTIGGNDFDHARAQYQEGTCGGTDNQDCLRALVSAFAATCDTIMAEIAWLGRGHPVIVRVVDIYYPFIATDRTTTSWPDGGRTDLAVLGPYLAVLNSSIARSAARYQVRVARASEAFNGDAGNEDPAVAGLLAADGEHPSERGNVRITERLRHLGYAPLR